MSYATTEIFTSVKIKTLGCYVSEANLFYRPSHMLFLRVHWSFCVFDSYALIISNNILNEYDSENGWA